MDYDIGIIGGGVAGVFAAHRIAIQNPESKTVIFDIGRPQGKRRAQTYGWLGCFPNSDGKLYLEDVKKVGEIVGNKKANSAFRQISNIIRNISDYKIIKDKAPSVGAQKRMKKLEYDYYINNYIQMFPKEIHALSKLMFDQIEEANNTKFSFDNEVYSIFKQKDIFIVNSQYGEFKCKKLLISTGRAGWRWCKDIYQQFGIIENNDYARFGVKVEMDSSAIKDFNKSNCTITKGEVEIGPLCWYGTVIPEDHSDVAISAFRSNEQRWKTDKVSFNYIKNIYLPNEGCEQTDRIAKLTFILANDRIVKEKISSIINGKSKISIIPEYNWIKQDMEALSSLMPELINKGYFHVPTICPLPPKINIGDNLETEVEGMFVAGENAGIIGILAAATMGYLAADGMSK